MSGLFGVLDSAGRLPLEPLLAEMGRAMSHREWYVVETHHEAQVGLGRIGIGIFNKERQPAASEDGTLQVFLTGELQGAAELRREVAAQGNACRDESDAELALRLYQTHGELFIQKLEGAFVLAIWNRRERELLVVNDRAGLYPHYYAHWAGRLVFAPEMKGVLCDPGFGKELDLVALAEYVRFQFLLGDKTFFQGLHVLPNATLLRYRLATDTLTLQSYWDLSQLPAAPASLTFEEATEETGRLLRQAMARATVGPYRLGLYLSAGMDSRVLLGFFPRDRLPVRTITYGLPQSRDAIYARQVVRAARQVEPHYFEVANGLWVKDHAAFHLNLTEGFHSWIHAHGIQILAQVRPLMDVNVTGFGGELNWEEPVLYGAPDALAFESRLFYLLCQETTWPSVTEAEARLVFSSRLAAQMPGLAFDSFHTELSRYAAWPVERRAAQFTCSVDRRFYQYHVIFNRSHVEQRIPFYDYRYFEFIYALPPAMRSKRKLRRAVINRYMPALARVPYDKDNLPISAQGTARKLAEFVQRGKNHLPALFAPAAPLNADYENWLRHELRAWGEELLLGEPTRAHDIFNVEFLRSLWQRHQSGLEPDFLGKLAPFMTYEMLLRQFWL